jgi:hypothetical protein
MMFTPVRRARITYAVLMASMTCIIMSAVTTSLLSPEHHFWTHWPRILVIDLCIAIPVVIMLGPVARAICHWLYPQLER